MRQTFNWRLRTRSLLLGERTVLMGILNITPDSFSDGGQFLAPRSALDHALRMLDEGADLLDLGGESTRPNATPISADEEKSRVIGVLAAILKARPDAILSVDTYHAETARAALEGGAEIINDVSGLLWDPAMAGLLAEAKPGAILMHTRGAPRIWRELPQLDASEVMPLVVSGLTHTLKLAREAGIPGHSSVLDPGFGFGKLGNDNYVLLAHFAELQQFKLPLLAGTSRKRFLAAGLPNADATALLHATTASHVAAILAGSHILRVHDVSAARAAAAVADRILAAQS